MATRRTHTPEFKRSAVEASNQAGASIAGVAMAYGINANQLRKWIRMSVQRKAVLRTLPAFVPVVAVDGAPPPPATARPSMPHDALSRVPISVPDARLTARLPNGVTVELACGGQHAPLLRTMLEALGAPGCSASTRR